MIRKIIISLLVALVVVLPPVLAFDLGKTLSDSVGKTVKDVVNKTTGSIGDTITSMIPKPKEDAEKDDGEVYDLTTGVTIFGYDGCPYCRKAYSFLDSNNVEYTLMDVEKSTKANRIFKKEGHRGVPVIYIEGETLSGFSDSSYRSLLQKHEKL
jgi:Glutaredoxin and related proteins